MAKILIFTSLTSVVFCHKDFSPCVLLFLQIIPNIYFLNEYIGLWSWKERNGGKLAGVGCRRFIAEGNGPRGALAWPAFSQKLQAGFTPSFVKVPLKAWTAVIPHEGKFWTLCSFMVAVNIAISVEWRNSNEDNFSVQMFISVVFKWRPGSCPINSTFH